MRFPVIAIDGPAGAGKSTVARALASRLGFFLLDTGAIYRSLALYAARHDVSSDDGPRLGALALRLPLRFGRGPQEEGKVFLDEPSGTEDVTSAIRTPEISQAASQVSVHKEVRDALLDVQRQLAQSGPCVAEGRDIGTVVLPEAPIKLFMTASSEVRARRRFEELRARGVIAAEGVNEQQAIAETTRAIDERDRRDETRETAPTRQADDAIRFDTSELSLEEVIGEVEALCRSKLGIAPASSAQ